MDFSVLKEHPLSTRDFAELHPWTGAMAFVAGSLVAVAVGRVVDIPNRAIIIAAEPRAGDLRAHHPLFNESRSEPDQQPGRNMR